MANKIQIKRSTTASAVPTAGQLDAGELAINTADGRLFAKKSNGTVVNLPVSSISGQDITPGKIVGGSSNSAGTGSAVVGGLSNTANYSYSFIGGGFGNTVNADKSVVCGGQNNTASGQYATVCGGLGATASGQYSFVGGGVGNTASAYYSTVGGGKFNSASGTYSTVSGGYANTASGDYSVVAGGGGNGGTNTASGHWAVIAGGKNNNASSSYAAIVGGANNTASATYSIAGGYRAKAAHYGAFAQAAGYFAQPGDAQAISTVLRNSTTNATATSLYLDGSTVRLVIPSSTVWTFSIRISAITSTASAAAGWHIRGVIRNSSSNSAALVGSLVSESWADSGLSAATATATIVSSGSNQILDISITGISSTTIRWVAAVDIAQTSFGTP